MGKRQEGSGTEKKLGSGGRPVEGTNGKGWPSIQEHWGSDLEESGSFLTLSPSGIGCWSRGGEDHSEGTSAGPQLAGL